MAENDSSELGSYARVQYSAYRAFIHGLGDDLTTTNIKELKFLSNLPGDHYNLFWLAQQQQID